MEEGALRLFRLLRPTVTPSFRPNNNFMLVIRVTDIQHLPGLSETPRRVQGVFHKLHERHLTFLLVHFSPDAERRDDYLTHSPRSVTKTAEDTYVDRAWHIAAVEGRFGRRW